MIEIAVYHHDSEYRKKVSQDFINSLKQSQVYGKVYSIQNLQKFSENLLNGKYQFDIICIDTAEKEHAQRLMNTLLPIRSIFFWIRLRRKYQDICGTNLRRGYIQMETGREK